MNEKLYKQLVNLDYAVFSNNDMLAKILSDEKFKDNVLQTINGLMFLEKKHSVTLKGVQFGKSVGRALVKLLNEKVAFSISSLTTEKIEEEIIFFSNLISNTYGITKDEILDSKKTIKETDFIEFVKEYKENEIVGHNNTTIQDEATVQINNINAGSAENIKVNNPGSNQQRQNHGQPNFNGQPSMGQLFQNPMNSERFYPFKTKPKEMKWIKFAFAASMIVIGIMFIIIYAILGAEQIKFSHDDAFSAIFTEADKDAFNLDAFGKAYVDYFEGNWIFTPFTLISKNPNLATGTNTFSIILNIFMILILFSSVYPMLKQPKFYRDQYHVNGGTLFLFGFVIVMFAFPLFFSKSGGITSMIMFLGFKGADTTVIANNFLEWMFTSTYLGEHADEKAAFVSVINDQMNLVVLKVLSIMTIVFMFIFVAMYIAILLINPKIDREKYRLFIMEVQKKAMAQMQGQSYEIDPSLFESDEEMAAWEKKKNRDNK